MLWKIHYFLLNNSGKSFVIYSRIKNPYTSNSLFLQLLFSQIKSLKQLIDTLLRFASQCHYVTSIFGLLIKIYPLQKTFNRVWDIFRCNCCYIYINLLLAFGLRSNGERRFSKSVFVVLLFICGFYGPVKQRRIPQITLLKAFNPFKKGGCSNIVKLICNIHLKNSIGYCV